MAMELSTKNTPKIIVSTKTPFSTPLKDLYILKDPLSPEVKPALFDCINTRTTSRAEIII